MTVTLISAMQGDTQYEIPRAYRYAYNNNYWTRQHCWHACIFNIYSAHIQEPMLILLLLSF